MNPTIKNIIKYLAQRPKTLFLIDGLGAALTTFFLFVVLSNLYAYFGIPKQVLNYLSLIGITLCIYAMTCFFLLKSNWAPFIRAMSIANLFYCVLTMVFMYIYFQELSTLGVIYFSVEIAIIVTLALLELNVATAIK